MGEVAEILSEHTFTGARRVELTESSLVEDPDQAVSAWRRPASSDPPLAINDSAPDTHRSDTLQRYPIEILKVRRALRRLGRHPDGQTLAEGDPPALASSRDATVAEGVADRLQVDALRALGCGYAQGFHFSRPLTADEFAALLGMRALERRAPTSDDVALRRA